MPSQRTYNDLLAWYRNENYRVEEYIAPEVRIFTLKYLPTYVRGATPVGLTAELSSGVYAWGFDFSSTAPVKIVRSKMHSALEKLNKSDFATQYGVVTHAFLYYDPRTSHERWPGNLYFIGGLFLTAPLIPATGIQLGSTGIVLQQIAKAIGAELRNEGHLFFADFTDPQMDYIMSFLDLAADVITSEEIMRVIPQPKTAEPAETAKIAIPQKWLMWGGIGLGVLLLLILLTRHGD